MFIAWIYSTLDHINETINTLKYASRAKKIKSTIKKNISINAEQSSENEQLYIAIVDKLKLHVAQLKEELEEVKLQNINLNTPQLNDKSKRRYSLPGDLFNQPFGHYLGERDPLEVANKYKQIKESLADWKLDKNMIEGEISKINYALEIAKQNDEDKDETQKRSTLNLYVNELFMIIQDNCRVWRDIVDINSEIEQHNIDISTLDSPTKIQDINDSIDDKEFKIIELKVSLAENAEDYWEVVKRIK